MEGREMLSAGAFDLTALNLSEGQTVVVAKPTEGGFISARYSVAGLLSNNQLVLSGWNGDALHLTFSGTSSDAASPVGMAAGNGGAPGWVVVLDQSASPQVATDYAHPVELFGDLGGLIPAAGGPPSESQPVDRDEGGAIPIAAIHSELKSGLDSGFERFSIKALAAGSAVSQAGDSEALLAASVSSAEISGEWARAIAFEFVGDGPTEVTQSAHNSRGMSRLLDQSVSNETDARLSVHAAQRGDATPRSEPTVTPARADHSVANAPPSDLSAMSLPLQPLASALLPMAAPVSSQMASAIEAARGTAPAVAPSAVDFVTDAAMAEAFGEWSGEGVAARYSFATDHPWDNWGSTPLLLILALERISASNTRRAKRGDARELRLTAVSLPKNA